MYLSEKTNPERDVTDPDEQQQGMQMLSEECVWRMSLRKTDA